MAATYYSRTVNADVELSADDLGRTVFCGALWWQDCDPIAGVVAFDRQQAERTLSELAEEELARVADGYEENEEAPDDLCDSGVSPYTLAWWIENALPYGQDGQQALNDLLNDGQAVI